MWVKQRHIHSASTSHICRSNIVFFIKKPQIDVLCLVLIKFKARKKRRKTSKNPLFVHFSCFVVWNFTRINVSCNKIVTWLVLWSFLVGSQRIAIYSKHSKGTCTVQAQVVIFWLFDGAWVHIYLTCMLPFFPRKKYNFFSLHLLLVFTFHLTCKLVTDAYLYDPW